MGRNAAESNSAHLQAARLRKDRKDGFPSPKKRKLTKQPALNLFPPLKKKILDNYAF